MKIKMSYDPKYNVYLSAASVSAVIILDAIVEKFTTGNINPADKGKAMASGITAFLIALDVWNDWKKRKEVD